MVLQFQCIHIVTSGSQTGSGHRDAVSINYNTGKILVPTFYAEEGIKLAFIITH